MILTDYFRSTHDVTWDFALQSGVRHGVIRLPEDEDFDVTDPAHWRGVHDRFTAFGLTPLIVEPMPNALHDHIKAGDSLRDASIEKVIKMLPIMRELGMESICFNWMAHIGWLRTRSDHPERGGARVTEFCMEDFQPTGQAITVDALWANYKYFLDAVIPYAEQCGIKLALHPDDPPVPRLGEVSRIMISRDSIRRAIREVHPSEYLGLTMCQANYHIMGEDLDSVIEEFADRIFFVHFRNTTGTPTCFRETFHDNGALDMPHLIKVYQQNGIDVPIRVDHVPTMAGEVSTLPGYDAMGRLFAIGYLKGILEANGALTK